jgi:hypothetical protein
LEKLVGVIVARDEHERSWSISFSVSGRSIAANW